MFLLEVIFLETIRKNYLIELIKFYMTNIKIIHQLKKNIQICYIKLIKLKNI